MKLTACFPGVFLPGNPAPPASTRTATHLCRSSTGFEGVVIVTMNLFENYDPALLHRIQSHIKFRVPNASMRRELFALHLPNPERVRADYAVLAELSGGDILNICVNAIYTGSTDANPERWLVTQAMIQAEIAKAKKAKAEHSVGKAGPKRRIGFRAS